MHFRALFQRAAFMRQLMTLTLEISCGKLLCSHSKNTYVIRNLFLLLNCIFFLIFKVCVYIILYHLEFKGHFSIIFKTK